MCTDFIRGDTSEVSWERLRISSQPKGRRERRILGWKCPRPYCLVGRGFCSSSSKTKVLVLIRKEGDTSASPQILGKWGGKVNILRYIQKHVLIPYFRIPQPLHSKVALAVLSNIPAVLTMMSLACIQLCLPCHYRS